MGLEVEKVTKGFSLLFIIRDSHLPSPPGSGATWSPTPATLRKQEKREGEEKALLHAGGSEAGAEAIQHQSVGSVRDGYSLQMLKGRKGLKDPHQSGESLGAQDRAQPRRQRAEIRPQNSPRWGSNRTQRVGPV